MYKKQALVEGVRAFSILYHCINTKQYRNVLSSSASVSTFSSMFSSRGVGGHGVGGGGVGKKLGTRSGRKEGNGFLTHSQPGWLYQDELGMGCWWHLINNATERPLFFSLWVSSQSLQINKSTVSQWLLALMIIPWRCAGYSVTQSLFIHYKYNPFLLDSTDIILHASTHTAGLLL